MLDNDIAARILFHELWLESPELDPSKGRDQGSTSALYGIRDILNTCREIYPSRIGLEILADELAVLAEVINDGTDMEDLAGCNYTFNSLARVQVWASKTNATICAFLQRCNLRDLENKLRDVLDGELQRAYSVTWAELQPAMTGDNTADVIRRGFVTRLTANIDPINLDAWRGYYSDEAIQAVLDSVVNEYIDYVHSDGFMYEVQGLPAEGYTHQVQ